MKLKHYYYFLKFFIYDFECFICMCVWAPYMCLVPVEARIGYPIPWKRSYRCLWDTMRMLGGIQVPCKSSECAKPLSHLFGPLYFIIILPICTCVSVWAKATFVGALRAGNEPGDLEATQHGCRNGAQVSSKSSKCSFVYFFFFLFFLGFLRQGIFK